MNMNITLSFSDLIGMEIDYLIEAKTMRERIAQFSDSPQMIAIYQRDLDRAERMVQAIQSAQRA